MTAEEKALLVSTLHQKQSGDAQSATGRLRSAFFPPEQLAVQGCPATSLPSLHLTRSPAFLVPSCMCLFQRSPSILGTCSASLRLYARKVSAPYHSTHLLCLLSDPRSQHCPQLPPVCHLPSTSVLGLGSNRFSGQLGQHRSVSGYWWEGKGGQEGEGRQVWKKDGSTHGSGIYR